MPALDSRTWDVRQNSKINDVTNSYINRPLESRTRLTPSLARLLLRPPAHHALRSRPSPAVPRMRPADALARLLSLQLPKQTLDGAPAVSLVGEVKRARAARRDFQSKAARFLRLHFITNPVPPTNLESRDVGRALPRKEEPDARREAAISAKMCAGHSPPRCLPRSQGDVANHIDRRRAEAGG